MTGVDVVVPCYRYGEYLPTAVRSVLDQPGVDVRVLIIDDASDDGSGEVAQSLASSDERVEAVVHTQNRGHLATFNEGVVDWASAELTLLMSADDALTPGALGRAAALFDEHPGVGLVYGAAITYRGGPLPPARLGPVQHVVHPGHAWLRGRFAAATNVVSSPAAVTRTAVNRQVGGYDQRLRHTSDHEMWMRLALVSDVGFVRGADQAYWRTHDVNMHTAYLAGGGVEDLREVLRAHDAVLEKAALGGLSDGDELARTVRRRLARDAYLRAARAHDRGRVEADGADALIAFAEEIVEDTRTLPERRAYELRQLVGPTVTRSLGPVLPTAAGRRLRQRWRDRRRERIGV
ncbi:glycosyltransferase family 2 protein [Actinomycetospora aeridis]|uniref:Glycosyltransferase family 2 protein n=1 Tax=Actinomycetospora aeridis TaxID=3129231 RepID=A0ABU8N7S6_9PSEU